MKANEAPKKLYLIQHGGLICYCRNNNDDIEYIRTDAFIERALEWVRKEIRPYYSDVKYKYEDFKKYMEL